MSEVVDVLVVGAGLFDVVGVVEIAEVDVIAGVVAKADETVLSLVQGAGQPKRS